jgi:hypothetical protein
MSVLKANKVVIKLYLAEGVSVDQAEYIPVFHRFIREKIVPDIWIDVADYRHVHEGPGVMMIGHETNFAMDQGAGRTGLLFNRKRGDLGGLAENLNHAINSTLVLAKAMEEAPEFKGALRFSTGRLYIGINDRLLAPNEVSTHVAVDALLKNSCTTIYGDETLSIEPVEERRELFGVHLSMQDAPALETMIERLQP